MINSKNIHFIDIEMTQLNEYIYLIVTKISFVIHGNVN